jgi:curli biogenesis system outer membrane secretion channel CsgG
MAMKSRFVCVMVAAWMAAVSAYGQWQTQATLANNAYQGSIALDASGNKIAIWYQNAVNGNLTEEIWASNATFGGAWSSPVDISGGTDSDSGPGHPIVHVAGDPHVLVVKFPSIAASEVS